MAFARQSIKPIHAISPIEAPIQKSHFQITVKGALKNPGKYSVPANSTVQDLVDELEMLDTADISQLKLRQKLKDKQRLTIPEKKLITIYVEGAIETPGALHIMSGTRCQELVQLIQLPPEADGKMLQKRKHYLKEGEIVIIPFKKNIK